MDDDTPTEPRPRPPAKMSMTPSWVMLGFVLGAFFVWALPEPEKTPPSPQPAPEQRAPERMMLAARLPRLTDVEAVFAQWDRYAIWDNDATEVAYWNEETKSFANFFEVLRVGDRLFFRSIPKLTRPLIKRGVEAQSPFLFTGVAEAAQPISERAILAPMPEPPVERSLPPKIVPPPPPTAAPPPLDPALSPTQPTSK